MKERFGAENPRSWMLRFHTQTAGVSLTAQQPYNNVVRTALQALSADTEGTGALPASFAWLAAGVSVPLPASLGDFVWLDDNRNGIQDPGEPGVEDVLVTLNDCNGNLVDSQSTGPDGEYLFTLLEPGCYQVTFTAPDGTSFTIQNAGPDDIDSDADPATGVTPQVTLASGEQNLTIDAGNGNPGATAIRSVSITP